MIATIREPAKGNALAALGRNVEIHLLDVSDRAAIVRLAQELSGQPIDVLFCNAGIYGPKNGAQNFGKADWVAWAKVLQTNVMAPMALAEAFVDHVGASAQKRIVMMSSAMGSINTAGGGSYLYRSSKAALNAVTKNLSVDLAGRDICVIAVSPGWVKTDMGGANAPLSPEASVRGLRAVTAQARQSESGKFFNYDGSEIPW